MFQHNYITESLASITSLLRTSQPECILFVVQQESAVAATEEEGDASEAVGGEVEEPVKKGQAAKPYGLTRLIYTRIDSIHKDDLTFVLPCESEVVYMEDLRTTSAPMG